MHFGLGPFSCHSDIFQVHEHFTPSTDFFRSFAEVFYAVGNSIDHYSETFSDYLDEIAIMRMLGFLKRWIIVDRAKFLNKSELGISHS
jgi:hypothetical protein